MAKMYTKLSQQVVGSGGGSLEIGEFGCLGLVGGSQGVVVV